MAAACRRREVTLHIAYQYLNRIAASQRVAKFEFKRELSLFTCVCIASMDSAPGLHAAAQVELTPAAPAVRVKRSIAPTRGNELLEQLDAIDAYSEVVFSAVLFANINALDYSVVYAAKALHNIAWLQQKYRNCTIVVYYDESVSTEFMEHAVELQNVILVFVDHNVTEPTTMMMSRLLELERRRKRWTVLLDIHDELEKQFNFNRGVQDAAVRVVKDSKELVRIPIFSANLPVELVEFPNRIPSRVIDAAGFGISQGLQVTTSLQSTIADFLSKYKYTYGDDEFVIDTWLLQTQKWDQVGRTNEVQEVVTDPEHDMVLSGLLKLDPKPMCTKMEANASADEVVDWTTMSEGITRKASLLPKD
jgi:hypothetical protein